MGVRRRHGHCLTAAVVPVLFFFFVMAMLSNCSSALVGVSQEKEEANFMNRKMPEDERWVVASAGRRLAGPGSSPPTCRLRCGRCLPCRPVHVAIQPGRSFPLEYYPEAWRCKCGNKLFMP